MDIFRRGPRVAELKDSAYRFERSEDFLALGRTHSFQYDLNISWSGCFHQVTLQYPSHVL
jgi:hypothetical protein